MNILKLIEETERLEALLNGKDVKVYYHYSGKELIIEAFASCEKTGKNIHYGRTVPLLEQISAKFPDTFIECLIDEFIAEWNSTVAS